MPLTEKPDATADKILDAALRCFEEVGVRRTSMDDIAATAGVARATIFRKFENKDSLVELVLLRIVEEMTERVRDAYYAGGDLETALTEAVVTSVRELRERPLFSKVLRTEPDAFLRTISNQGATLIAVVGSSVVSWLGAARGGPLSDLDAAMVAEWITRIGVSLIISPDGLIPIDDEAALRAYVARYLVPGIARLAVAPG